MEQSPSWEANWFAASQDTPGILWNPKFHHRIHKCAPSIPILGQLHPVSTPSHFPILFQYNSFIIIVLHLFTICDTDTYKIAALVTVNSCFDLIQRKESETRGN